MARRRSEARGGPRAGGAGAHRGVGPEGELMPKRLAPETYADREARRQDWAEREEERKRRNREKLAPLVENPSEDRATACPLEGPSLETLSSAPWRAPLLISTTSGPSAPPWRPRTRPSATRLGRSSPGRFSSPPTRPPPPSSASRSAPSSVFARTFQSCWRGRRRKRLARPERRPDPLADPSLVTVTVRT